MDKASHTVEETLGYLHHIFMENYSHFIHRYRVIVPGIVAAVRCLLHPVLLVYVLQPEASMSEKECCSDIYYVMSDA